VRELPSGSDAETESCTGAELVAVEEEALGGALRTGGRLAGGRTSTVTAARVVRVLLLVTVTSRKKEVSSVTWGAVHEGLATEVLLKVPAGDAGVCFQA
jgi:hypothetical protein